MPDPTDHPDPKQVAESLVWRMNPDKTASATIGTMVLVIHVTNDGEALALDTGSDKCSHGIDIPFALIDALRESGGEG